MIIHKKKVVYYVFRNTHTETHTFVTITMNKRPFESEQGRFGGIWEDLEGRNGKKKLFNYAVNNKNENIKF